MKLREERLKELTPLQFEVTQNNATERPFTGEYDQHFEPGLYVDIVSGEPLFLSQHKFDAGCGWPAFTRPVSPDAVREKRDVSHGMERIEIRSSRGNSHLGHVFSDGPIQEGGLRYCINSAALRFIPLSRLSEEGYGEYRSLFGEPYRIMGKDKDIAEILDHSLLIYDAQSALDLFMTVNYHTRCHKIILNKSCMTEEFFILSTGVAGEILQKCANYHIRLAVVGDYSRYTSKPLKDFIYETNQGNQVYFLPSVEEAVKRLEAL